MLRKRFPQSLLFFILGILTLQLIATYFYWYWRIWWFDILMHFLGGLWVGASVLWVYVMSGIFSAPAQENQNKQRRNSSLFVLGVVVVLCVAIFWELFEYLIRVFVPHDAPFDVFDTLSDIFFGLLGGSLASFVFMRKKHISL